MGRYASLFAEGQGAPAKPVRLALGALIIKEKCGLSDRDTVEQIRENPYLQFFSMGKIAPAFNQIGGGIQYELPNSIEYLIKNGYLKEIK